MLDAAQRREIARAMLEDVVAVVATCRHLAPVALVTGDAYAQALARGFGLDVIEESENPGESGAIDMATRACEARGVTTTLVLPADIPLIRQEEVAAIFAAAPHEGIVLAPSWDRRGSNAVLRRPASLIPLRFGNDSFEPHLEAATATGQPCVVLTLSGIGLDVDTPEDLIHIAEAEGETRAQRLARSWGLVAKTAVARQA
jgi:2-phospho-L-lactate guanylyltransferase